jgi:putative transposase
MSTTVTELRDAGLAVSASCELVGRSRATHYRHARPPVHGPAEARRVPDNGQALTAQERAAVLELINRDE